MNSMFSLSSDWYSAMSSIVCQNIRDTPVNMHNPKYEFPSITEFTSNVCGFLTARFAMIPFFISLSFI